MVNNGQQLLGTYLLCDYLSISAMLAWGSNLSSSAIDSFGFLKMLRLLRVIEWDFVRLVMPSLWHQIMKSVLIMVTLIWIFAGLMLTIEYPYRHHYEEVEGNAFVCWHDAMYFAMATLTTVGYGDLKPKTVAGRLFSALFILVGVALFSMQISQVTETISRRPKWRTGYVQRVEGLGRRRGQGRGQGRGRKLRNRIGEGPRTPTCF